MIFEETEYFDLKQVEANICVYLGFAIIYVVQRLFMFQIKEDCSQIAHQLCTDSLYLTCINCFQELVPHLFTEQSLGPNVSVISKKRKRKTRTVFSRFNSLFCPFFFKETENF